MRKLRLVLAAFALAGIAALAYSAFPSVSAHAQDGQGRALVFKSAGPIQMNNNEGILIGLLLPAVQRPDLPFRLELFDSAGHMLADIPVIAAGDGSVRPAAYDVFFADGSVRVADHQTGKVLAEKRQSDGVFTAVLLPAVQKGGRTVGAISASLQIFNADHQRGQIIGMCDGSV